MIWQGCQFNEADDATANEADVVDKPARAEVAEEADEANEAEADEDNAEADVADEAIVANEIDANVIGEIIAADKANVIGDVVAIDVVNEAN